MGQAGTTDRDGSSFVSVGNRSKQPNSINPSLIHSSVTTDRNLEYADMEAFNTCKHQRNKRHHLLSVNVDALMRKKKSKPKIDLDAEVYTYTNDAEHDQTLLGQEKMLTNI